MSVEVGVGQKLEKHWFGETCGTKKDAIKKKSGRLSGENLLEKIKNRGNEEGLRGKPIGLG